MTSNIETTRPWIWAASNSEYDRGVLHGRRIAITNVTAVQGEIDEMLADAADEPGNWLLLNWQGWGDTEMGCTPEVEQLVAVGQAIATHGVKAASAFVNRLGGADHIDADTFGEQMEEAFLGSWPNLAEWAKHHAIESKDLFDWMTDWPFSCVDWEIASQELLNSGGYWTEQDGELIAVFLAVEL